MTGRTFLTLFGRWWSTPWKFRGGNVTRALYAGGLLIYLGLPLLFASGLLRWGYAGISAQVRSQFYELSVAQFWLATALGPLIFAPPLLREKEKDSLDLLLVSQAPRPLILLGLAAGRLAAALVFLLAGLPALCFLANFGGISYGEILSTHLLLAGQLGLVGGLSILLAVYLTRAFHVMAVVWGIVLAYLLGPELGRLLHPTPVTFWDSWDRISTFAILKSELIVVWPQPVPSLVAAGCGVALLLLASGAGGLVLQREGRIARERTDHGWLGRTIRGALDQVGSAGIIRRVFSGEAPGDHWLGDPRSSREGRNHLRAIWLLFTLGYFALVAVASWLPEPRERWLHLVLLNGVGFGLPFLLFLRTAHSAIYGKRSGAVEVFLGAGAEPLVIVAARLHRALVVAAWFMAPVVTHGTGAWIGYGHGPGLPGKIILWLVGTVVGVTVGVVASVWIAMRSRGVAGALAGTILFAGPLALIAWFVTSLSFYIAVPLTPLALALTTSLYSRTIAGTDTL